MNMNNYLRLSVPEHSEEETRAHRKLWGTQTVPEWHSHNQRVLKGDIIGVTDRNSTNTKNCIDQINSIASNDYVESTDQIRQRAQHINYWTCELEQAILDITEEMRSLEAMRQRLKSAMTAIQTSESIAKECYKLRTNRMGSDLICDGPEEGLIQEIALIDDIKKIYEKLLKDMEDQMAMNIIAKEMLETDWSNKQIVYKNENDNLALRFDSTTVKSVPAVTRLMESQSNIQTWESFSNKALLNFKNALHLSTALRAKVDATMINAARDLRSQDVKMNEMLVNRVGVTEQVKTDLEKQLDLTLQKIVEVEQIIDQLNEEIQKLCQRLRISQTRLYNKNCRPELENCREGSLLGLIEEVKNLNDGITLLQNRLKESLNNKNKLIEERSSLENEITIKRKSLHIDRDRCLVIRSYYLSATTLCGH